MKSKAWFHPNRKKPRGARGPMTNCPIASALRLTCTHSYQKGRPSQQFLNQREDIRLAFWTSASSVDQLSLWQPFPSETSSSVLLSAAYCSFCSSRFKTVIMEREIREVWGKKRKRMITSSASFYG